MFRKYDPKQQFLLPLNLEDFVPENHIARVLNDIIDVVDINAIESTYSKEGCPAYHPRPLLKVLLYWYLIGIRSSRKLKQVTQTDTAFMYLAATQKPDFHTICRFRSEEKDCYYCPAAFEIPFTRIQKRKGEPDLRYYVCNYCSHCVLKNVCTESEKRKITRDLREHLESIRKVMLL